MSRSDNSNYHEYAIGGKTGYTSDALSILITMADNGNMKLVCVVLRTHGKNIYPDTTNLFNYAFDNFEKIELKGQETSEDNSEILEDESRENCGYVVVPKGVELSDLDMEMLKERLEHAREKLEVQQMKIKEHKLPVLVLVEGWAASFSLACSSRSFSISLSGFSPGIHFLNINKSPFKSFRQHTLFISYFIIFCAKSLDFSDDFYYFQ